MIRGDKISIGFRQLFLGVFLFELVDTAGRIHQHVLTGKERVRSTGDLQLHQRVFVPIFPFYRFFCSSGRAAQKTMTVTHILEHNVTVIGGMKIFFHNNFFINDGVCLN